MQALPARQGLCFLSVDCDQAGPESDCPRIQIEVEMRMPAQTLESRNRTAREAPRRPKPGGELQKMELPEVVTLMLEVSSSKYDNHALAHVNDHVVRISTMTDAYDWHSHPNSDETFLFVEGGRRIEFEQGELQLAPGQMATVPRGVGHRTLPVIGRSVNLTFEAAYAETNLLI